jgi:hypothetical protein
LIAETADSWGYWLMPTRSPRQRVNAHHCLCLAPSLSPHSRAHLPFFRLCPLHTPQLLRRPTPLFSTPRRDIHDAHSLIKGPRPCLMATFMPSRQLAGPPLIETSLRVFVSPRLSYFLAWILPRISLPTIVTHSPFMSFIPLVLASLSFHPYP